VSTEKGGEMKVPKQIKRLEERIGTKSKWTDKKIINRSSMEDFEQGRIAIRKDIVEQILEKILKKGQFCIIVGPRDSGKTWLCNALGFELKKRKKYFRFVYVDKDFNADTIWSHINTLDPIDRYWIIEDCQNNDLEVNEFLQKILQSEFSNFKFIFTIRKPTKLTPQDSAFFDLKVQEQCEIPLGEVDENSVKHVEDIIRSFIEIENVSKCVEVTDEEIKSVSKKWGYDLQGVSIRLKRGWNFQKGMRLNEIGDADVFESYWSPIGKTKLEHLGRRNVFLHISVLCQFEPLLVWSHFLHRIDQKIAMELENEEIIERTKWEGKYYFRIPERKAEWILKTLSYKENPEFVDIETVRILKEYIKSKPPNWTSVFRCLYISRDTRNELVKKILDSIFNDEEVWAVIKEMVEKNYFFSLSLFPLLSEVTIWMGQTQKIQDILYYIKGKGINKILRELSRYKISIINSILSEIYKIDRRYVEIIEKDLDKFYHNLEKSLQMASITTQCELCFRVSFVNLPLSKTIIDNIQKELKSGTANKISKALPALNGISKVITLRDFFASFQVSDWEIIIKNSTTFDSIYHLLCENLKRWEIDNAASNLAEALLKMDIQYLITQKGCSTYRLYGIIDRAKKLGLDVLPLVNCIIQSDVQILRELFLTQKKRDAEGIHEEPISAFLLGINGITDIAEKDLELSVALLIENLSKLSEEELNELFSQHDLKIINYFLSKPATQNILSCLRIIRKIDDSTWSQLITSSLLNYKQEKEQAFWLLWNIYRYDKSITKNIVKINKHLFFENIREDKFSDEWLLPLIGLLFLCDINIQKTLNKINIEKILKIIEEFARSNACVRLLLSLIALKQRLPKKEFEKFTLNLSIIFHFARARLRECIQNTKNIQLQKVLQDILQEY